MAAVMAVETPVAVEREGNVAVPAPPRQTTGATVDRGGHAPPVEQQDRLPASLGDSAELGEEGRRERIAVLPAQVDDAHARHRGADPGREHDPLERGPALGPRRRAPVHRNRSLECCALRGDRAGVVAGIGLLLVRGVVLLVDDHEPEVAHRGEDRRACAHDDARLAPRDPIALVAALGLAERRVENRHRVAEPLAEATDGLRRERDLRHEHDRAEATLRAPPRTPGDTPRSCRSRSARRAEDGPRPSRRGPGRRGRPPRSAPPSTPPGSAHREATRARPVTAAAPRGVTPDRCDELERASRRRAVVVGDPERQVDEGGRDLVEHLSDARELDPGRRLDVDLDDDATRRAPPEPAPARSLPCRRRPEPRT